MTYKRGMRSGVGHTVVRLSGRRANAHRAPVDSSIQLYRYSRHSE